MPRSVRKAAWRCCRSSRSGPLDTSASGPYRLFRNCALAVLNSGSHTDDAREIFDTYRDFGCINLMQRNQGIVAAEKRTGCGPSSTAR